jgi:hypothetical protein
MAERRDWVRGVLIVALLMLGFAFKGALIVPPSPPSNVASGEFDTGRALARLQRILGDQRPHPVDTVADDAVRGRLIAELRAIGLRPEVHEAVDCSALPNTRFVSCSRVRNVVATIPGRSAGRHLLLNAHYDSTPTGPGASDDGLGVATMLEVGSILKASPPARPVTLLFNEGEEFGLNGSSAFVRTDPLAQQVNALINIDTRGVAGPALMFETSDPNGSPLSIYAATARRPYANSLSTDFAKLIPNTTDVVEFKPMHWTLLNFGIIDNETRYHSPGDTVAALDRASVYHVGSELLALTRAMASTAEPARADSGARVFTDIAGRAFIRLPLPFAEALLGLLLIAAFVIAWRERALTRPLLLAAGMTVAGIGASSSVAFVATLSRAGDFWRAYPLFTYLGVYAVLIASMTAVWARWGDSVERRRMRAAVWLLILLVGGVLSLALPGATIFFLIGPALALIGIALSRRSPQPGVALVVIAALVQFVMFAQLLALIEMLLIDGPLWAVTPLAALAVLPALIEIRHARARPAFAVLVLAAIGFWTAAMLLPRSSADRPASFSIDYFRDADHNTADWGVASKQAPLPRGFPGEWHKGVLPFNGRTRWISDAPLIDTPAPGARVISSEPAGTGRKIRIALSPGGANAITIRFAEGTKVLALGLPADPEPVPPTGEPTKATLRCSGRSCEGFVIEALLADRRPIQAELFSYRFSLPPEGRSLVKARPENAIPQYSPDETVTMKRARL